VSCSLSICVVTPMKIRPTGQTSDLGFSDAETALSFLYRLENLLCLMTMISLVPGDPSEPWEYGLLGGLLTVPLTVFGYWQTGSEMALSPISVPHKVSSASRFCGLSSVSKRLY